MYDRIPIPDALPKADTNIAQGKPAFQTTVAWGTVASLAVDGDTNSDYRAGSCQHNDMGDNPMWWVDLGKSFPINRVVIFNRQDCCSERINPFNIHIGYSDQISTNPKCGGDHTINVDEPSISVLCQGMTGRYVGIRLPGYSRVLTLCEVQVFSEQPLSTKISNEKLYELLKLEKQKTREQDETISTLRDKINDLASADSNSFPKPGLPLQPCPDSYSEYNNKCYKLSTEQMTFGEAKDVCQRDGGILAIIDAQDTNHLVVKKIRVVGKSYWIGLTDVRSEGTFVRSDEAESPAAYTNWYPHQPDNGGGEDCVEMSLDHDWNDAPCSSRLNFICEKEKISRWICPPLYTVGFKDRCFRLSTNKANFRRAKTICEREGGRLAVLQDEETDLFIRKKIRKLPYERTLRYWIGLSDVQEEGTFVWTDGTELTASDYTHWRPGNPDNAVVGDGEDCVEIRQELDYMWNDVDCRKKRHFVCEKDVALASVSDQTMLMTEGPPLETESSNNPGHEQHTTPGLDEDGCTWRIQELHEKDREVQEQAQTITELTAQLEQKDEEIHDVTTRLHQKEEEIHDVTTRLHQKEEEMQDVTIRLHQKEEEIQDVNIRLQWKDQEIQDVTTQLQWKDQEIQDVTTQLQWKDEEIQDLKIRLQQKEKEIQDLTNHLQQRQEENEQFSTEVGTPVTPAGSESRGYTSLGCWEDAYDRAIPTLEKTDARLDGDFFTRNNPIEKCYQVALSRGFPVFALQAGGWCAGSADAHTTHSKYGPSTACAADGEGGPWANEVYQITGMLPEECMVEPSLRQECGWVGITKHQCRQRRCCFDSSVPTAKFCFHKKAPKKWRDDHRCGQGYPAEDGNPAECDPEGGVPCCSKHNWCGNTADHCVCPDCVDYRNTVVPVSPSGELPDNTSHTAAELTHQNDDLLLHTTDRMQDFTTQLQQKEEEIRHFTTPLEQPPPTVQTTPSKEYCQEGNGASYRGTVSATKTGKTCQRWDSQTPHRHANNIPARLPSSGLEQNYCRNPDGKSGVWCYTTDPSTRWELCDVPTCATDVRATTCHEAKAMNPTGGDGEYTLYPFTACTDVSISVYCHNMASENPEEFLSLPSGPEKNYAIVFADRLIHGHLCDGPLQDQSADAGTTMFNKIRIKFENNTIMVIRDDFTFAKSNGYNDVSYAEAGDCYSWTQGCAKGTFQVNLEGTDLELAPHVDWIMEGWPGYLTINDMFISQDRKVASARCGGWCGRCRPVENHLLLSHPQCRGQIGTDVPVSPSGGLPDHTQHTAAELIHQNDDQLLHTTDRMQDFTTQLQQKEEEIRHFTTPLEQPPPTVQTTPSEEFCREGNGASYRGTVSATKTGKTCQRWDSQTPHGHGRTPANYPSSGLEENYCRNPDGELAVWCYTMDPNTRWEFCDVPVCGPYGQVKFTKSGVFVVPDGVTSVDVICIGGGGGGRDDHAEILGASPYGGNGGNSSFGPYLSAEGGKGAKAGNIGVWLTQDPSWVVYSTGKPWVMDGAVQDAAKVLDGDTGTYWNPSDTGNSYNNWYIVLDLTAPQTLTRIAVNNYGDITHDIAVFRLQKSSIASPYIWEDVVSVTDVRGGTVQRQEFGGFRGTARYWRFLITRTHEGWQPYLTELNLYAISLGGEGGEGTVAFGGQGGVGGGCSAGAGAAGQTSGGGGGLVPGSSTHPFCGAGGSSGGSSCGTGLADIPPGKSGPGGEDPDGRRGGQYGGGGGSRAGARAGGGGGYSRAEVHVTPGERIAVTVGEAGTPHYAKPGDGVVVVAWGREIDPTGDMATCPSCVDADCPCQESAAVTTQVPATTGVSVPTVDRTRCLGSSGFCPGADVTGATCVDGFCECSGSNYQRDTCLPVVGSCVVTRGSPVARAEAFQANDPKETLSCVADDNSKYEIHVLAVYKSSAPTRIFLEEPAGSADMNVYVTAGQLDRPLVLVLSSYGAVNWVLHLPEDVEVHKVLLMAFYVEKSDVTVRSGSVNDVQRLSGHTGGAPPCAYGEDNGGCKTVELLEYISGEFGPVSSLTGTFMADAWNLTIGNDPISTPTETSISPSTETSISAPETSIACEGTTLQLSCPAGETLEIDDANYGRTTTANSCRCWIKCNQGCQSANSLSIVRSACQGLQECTVEANNSVFGDPCPFLGKFLEATYHCVPEATVERGDPEAPPASFPEEP
ncbi:uncharacterized protein LOC144879470 [Branchiostoma floridae x Branchiostoma japonicum]